MYLYVCFYFTFFGRNSHSFYFKYLLRNCIAKLTIQLFRNFLKKKQTATTKILIQGQIQGDQTTSIDIPRTATITLKTPTITLKYAPPPQENPFFSFYHMHFHDGWSGFLGFKFIGQVIYLALPKQG